MGKATLRGLDELDSSNAGDSEGFCKNSPIS
jgi:hypothetical protein